MLHGTDSRYIHLMMTELECHFKLSNHALSTKDHLSESSRLVNKKQTSSLSYHSCPSTILTHFFTGWILMSQTLTLAKSCVFTALYLTYLYQLVIPFSQSAMKWKLWHSQAGKYLTHIISCIQYIKYVKETNAYIYILLLIRWLTIYSHSQKVKINLLLL